MVRWVVILAFCCAMGVCGSGVRAASSTLPTSAPSAQLEQYRQWVADLNDADAARRDAAFGQLLGLERADLPVLQRAAGEFRPLSPAQATALHQVVAHVFLTGETYEANRTAGFLGVRLGDVIDLNSAMEEGQSPRVGVVIIDRMPGFCGYQALRDGDIIVAVTDRPATPIPSLESLRVVIQSFAAGQTIHMQVIRQGQLVRTAAVLDGTPLMVNQTALEEMLRQRQDKAEEYWQSHFGQLLAQA